jgi:reactive intermediate/imine deaminase
VKKMQLNKVATDKAPAAIGPYSQAVVCGNMVFTSGQIPINPASGNVEAVTIEEQTEQVMKNLGEVLTAAGSSFEKAVKKFLEEIQKSRQPKIYRGKQTLKQLAGQNAGLANIEISDKNIKAFTHVAKKYHVDFALKKDTAAEQPRYLVFFKSRDADAITAAFQEFASRRMGREERPSIRDRLDQAKEQAAEKAEHRTIDREKVKVKDRSVQR